MSSREKKTKTELLRTNTFQRMLDLERKNKLNRMQNSPVPPLPYNRSRTTLSPTPIPKQNQPQSLQMGKGMRMGMGTRAMSAPSLSLTIAAKSANHDAETKYVIKNGDVVPEEDVGGDEESETSSICHSPGWDDLAGSKQKKEKKREAKEKKKEKEKAEAKALSKARTEAKNVERSQNRLSKLPPANIRLSNRAVTFDQYTSAPAPQSLQTPKEEPKEGRKPTTGDRSKRGSMEYGLKSFFKATQAVPVPWRPSSHASPSEKTPNRPSPAEEVPNTKTAPPAISRNDGFIGGLKLKLANEATVQERIQRLSVPDREKMPPVVKVDMASFPLSLGTFDNFDNGTADEDWKTEDPAAMFQDAVMYQDSVSKSQEPESIYEEAARIILSAEPHPKIADGTSMMERNIRKPPKKYPPNSSHFPMDGEVSPSWRNSSLTSNTRMLSQPRTSDDKSEGKRASSALSADRSTLNSTRETSIGKANSSESSIVRVDRTYVRRQRKQSEDRSVSGFEDESKVSEQTEGPSRGRRMSWTSIRSRTRNESTEAPSATKYKRDRSKSGNGIKKSDEVPAAIHFGQHVPSSPIEGSLLHRRISTKNTMPLLRGFKSAARAAFSRHSSAETYPSPIPNNHDASIAVGGQILLNKRSSDVVLNTDEKPLTKAERLMGQPLGIASHDDLLSGKLNSSNKTLAAMARNTKGPGSANDSFVKPAPIVSKDIKDKSHSRSTTDSSEDYSLDESSNVTTPMASKPTSYKDYFPKLEPADKDAMMTNVMPPGEKLEDRPKIFRTRKSSSNPPPSRSSDIPKFSYPTLTPNSSDSTPDLHRLTRPFSTPEYSQDLSFLPALKHQSLTKTLKDPNDEKKGKSKRSPLSQAQDPEHEPSLVKPAPLSLTSSNSSPPISPVSSQYLQNARLSLPRPPTRSGVPSPNPGNPEPIAKMFVVCCSCKYFHDMPSKIYECMASAESVVEDKDLGVSGVVSTSVRCPWCGHGMSTGCCAGWAALVVLREKLH